MPLAPLRTAALIGAFGLFPLTSHAQQGPCGLFEAVEPGDTFATIAARCLVNPDTLAAANPGIDGTSPEVASTLSLIIGDQNTSITIVGEPVSPGPRILQAPATSTDTLLVVTTPESQDLDPSDVLMTQVSGNWTRAGELCADPGFRWVITREAISVGGDICAISDVTGSAQNTVVAAICGANGVTVGRDFTFQRIDGATMGFVTGEQAGVLSLCTDG